MGDTGHCAERDVEHLADRRAGEWATGDGAGRVAARDVSPRPASARRTDALEASVVGGGSRFGNPAEVRSAAALRISQSVTHVLPTGKHWDDRIVWFYGFSRDFGAGDQTRTDDLLITKSLQPSKPLDFLTNPSATFAERGKARHHAASQAQPEQRQPTVMSGRLRATGFMKRGVPSGESVAVQPEQA